MNMYVLRYLLPSLVGVTALISSSYAEILVSTQEVEAWADSYYGRAVAEKRAPSLSFRMVRLSLPKVMAMPTTVDRLSTTAVLRIDRTTDGQGLLVNEAGPYREIGNGVFAGPIGENEWTDPYTINRFTPPLIAFNLDETGNVINFIPGLGDQVWTQANPWFNPRAMLVLFVMFGTIGSTGVLLFLWPQVRRFSNFTNYLGLFVMVTTLVFPYAIFGGFSANDSLTNQMSHGDTGRLWLMVLTANAMIVLAALLVYRLPVEWKQDKEVGVLAWGWLGRKLHVSIVALSATALLVVFVFFNLFGLKLPG